VTRRRIVLAALVAATMAWSSPAVAADKASALKDAQSAEVGKATLTNTPSGVLISLNLTAVPLGVHAFHIHAVGKMRAAGFQVGTWPFRSRFDQAWPVKSRRPACRRHA
jgi:Cu/Zn superoxide dismutase